VPMELASSADTDPTEILANFTPVPVIDTPSPYPLPRGEGERGKHGSVQVIEFRKDPASGRGKKTSAQDG